MNQDQRKFLIEQVTKACNEQAEIIEAEMPIRPSLNNYLVAACLDNTLQLQSAETLREKIKQRVLKFGKDDQLVSEEEKGSWRASRSRNRSEAFEQTVSVEAADIFVIPEAYKTAFAEYEKKKKEIEDKVKMLYAEKDTIIMKIQIGSNSILDKLIMQVDSLGDLSLMNTQLQLGAGEIK